MDIQSAGRSSNLQIWNTNARWFQLFRYRGAHIINERGKVLDVHGGVDAENRNIIVWNKHNGLNQQWDIRYVDEMRPEPKKGELNTDFGFFVERPFHIVSEMRSHRYLDMLGRNLVIKTSNGKTSQVFWFDQRSKTIKSQFKRGWSFDIQNAGRTANMQMWNTNSGWF